MEIRYTDAAERVPLPELDELPRILAERGSYVSYAVRSSWRYGLVPHRRGKTVYDPVVSPRAGKRY